MIREVLVGLSFMINKDLLPHHLRLALFLVELVVLHCHFFVSIDLRTSVVA